ncbi:MAG: glutathione peroxidase [Fimbriimonadaceae bacterium]|nr:glutathione peroxidase [Fimbriimonadaceae bacterium]
MGSQEAKSNPDPEKTVYDFTMDSIDSKPVKLDKYKGQVLLVVNVASKCGLTPQYEGLQKLYTDNKAKGFEILGFPANEFGGQEPGTNAEILEFCTGKYNVSFPMFSKIVVKGEGTHPLYQWLLNSTENKKDIEWNFAKFLIGRDGKVVARFAPQVKPDSPELTKAIAKALEAK